MLNRNLIVWTLTSILLVAQPEETNNSPDGYLIALIAIYCRFYCELLKAFSIYPLNFRYCSKLRWKTFFFCWQCFFFNIDLWLKNHETIQSNTIWDFWISSFWATLFGTFGNNSAETRCFFRRRKMKDIFVP